jgi:peptide/nickel transport system ATP-binding protein
MASGTLLTVRDLAVRYRGAERDALAGLDLDLAPGRCLAVVGPSGCGKSTLCRALLDLLPAGASLDGSIVWQGRELTADRPSWRRVRGRGIGLVLQDHRYALDPVRRVGDQIAEVVRRHAPDLARTALRGTVAGLLAEVRLPGTQEFARRYPHQLSGGQRQRVCLAAALAAGPQLLLADEPTTALDLLVQREIILLLRELMQSRRLALLLVTHDRDLVPALADDVLALSEPGRRLPRPERPAASASDQPHRAAPRRPASSPCLRVRDLVVAVPTPLGPRRLLHPLSLELVPGRTLGLAGESGAGKTTLARALAGWLPLTAGRIELTAAEGLSPDARRRAVQMVSQDPVAALDPRQRVLAVVLEAARAAGDAPDHARQRALALLEEMDLGPELHRRRPAALSGGQRQRLQLARALAARPRVLIADEPASSLDPDRRERLLALLRDAELQHGLALVLISHDLPLLERWCDRVAVLHAGHLVEIYRPGSAGQPRHPFARDLAAATPTALARATTAITGSPSRTASDAAQTAVGCPYAPHCGLAQDACRIALPPLRDLGRGHLLRCPVTDHHAG